MGRSDSGSSAGAIAVIVIGGIVVLLLLGCAGLAAMSFLFVAQRSPAPQVAYPTTSQPAARVPAGESQTSLALLPPYLVTNNADGAVLVDGQAYTDDALPGLVAADRAGVRRLFLLELSSDLAADRRAEIEKIFAEANAAAATPTEIVEPTAP